MKSYALRFLRLAATCIVLAGLTPLAAQTPAPAADEAAQIKTLLNAVQQAQNERAYGKAREQLDALLARPGITDGQRIDFLRRRADAWRGEQRYDEARADYERILALPGADTRQRVDALNRLADTWRGEKRFDEARAEYERIVALPAADTRQRVDALNRLADTWRADQKHEAARKVYDRIMELPGITTDDRVNTLLRTADACIDAGAAAEALKACEKASALPDLAEKHRPGLLQQQAAANLAAGETAAALAAIVRLAQGGPASGGPLREACKRLASFAATRLNARDFDAAAAAYGQLAGITNLDLRVRSPAVKGLTRCCAGRRSAETRESSIKSLGALLDEIAAHPATTAHDSQIARLQRAALPVLDGKTAAAEQALDAMLAGNALGDEQAKVALLHDANILFMSTRAYKAAQLLKARIDARLAAAYAPNRYTCRFNDSLPVDAGTWAASAFVANAANLNTAFLPYPDGEADKLAADMGATRPLAEKDPEAMRGRETAVAMAYDTHGWHMFIRSDDPDIAQIMREGGRRGSSLEMFFAPGLKDEIYYQWIIRLAENKLNIYDWNTPHRFYRYLENRPGSLQVDTAVLPRGWATLVTVGWEAVYDKLPFIEGNEATWRFSTMRWGPVSTTWGGTVHEPGRWGLVDFAPPTPEQATEIRRELVRKAWWRYTSRRDALKGYWGGARGDRAFMEQVLTPFFQQQDAFAERMKGVDTWAPAEVADIFQKQVPVWMEIDVIVDEQRKQYLKQALTADKP